MNGKKAAEEFGKISDKYISEAFEPSRSESGQERSIVMKSKKRLIAVGLAAAMVIAVGGVTLAANLSNLSGIDNYYKKMEGYAHTSDTDIPRIDINLKGTELDVDGDNTPEPLKPGEARVTSAVASKYRLDVTVDVNVSEMNIPNELPEDALYGGDDYFIESVFISQKDYELPGYLGYSGGTLVSRNGDIMTFIISADLQSSLPENEVIDFKLRNICYTTFDGVNKNSTPLFKGDIDFEFDTTDIRIMDSKYSVNSGIVDGIEYTVELSPSNLILTRTDPIPLEELEELYSGEHPDEVVEHNKMLKERFESTILELHMTDGTVLNTSWKDADGNTPDIRLLESGGCSDNEMEFRFVTLLDLDQIDYVTVNGVDFTF